MIVIIGTNIGKKWHPIKFWTVKRNEIFFKWKLVFYFDVVLIEFPVIYTKRHQHNLSS